MKVVHDELTDLLAADTAELTLGRFPVILLVNLQGAGKTTAAAKLALQLQDAGRCSSSPISSGSPRSISSSSSAPS